MAEPATAAPSAPIGSQVIQPTSMSGVLDDGYKLRVLGPTQYEEEAFTDAELPAVPGEGGVSWFQWDGMYVALFLVTNLTSDPLCPGTSFQLRANEAPAFITYDSAGEGGCDEYPWDIGQMAQPPIGAYRCGPLLLFQSSVRVDTIPDSEPRGMLLAWLDRFEPDLSRGVASAAEITTVDLPLLDPSGSSYSFPEGTALDGVLTPGENVVNC